MDSNTQPRGLWAALPWPWDESGRVDEGALRRNLERYASVPVDGAYVADSDGEFYAIELDEYRRLVALFARHGADVGLPLQAGATWSHTRGVIDRIAACLDAGIDTVHVAFPYWMPIRRDEMLRFWDQLAAAAPDAKWIHYNTARGHLVLRGGDYERLAADHPRQFIGTKLAAQSPYDLADCVLRTPGLAHFATDFGLLPGAMLGACGCFSFWVNTLPKWTRRWADACLGGDWETARIMNAKFLEWEVRHVDPVFRQGYLHGIIGKARAELTGFLEDQGLTRAPYDPVPAPLKGGMSEAFRTFWADELADEGFAAP